MERMLVSSAGEFERLGVENVVVGQGKHHPYAEEMRSAGLAVYEMEPVGASLAAAKELRTLVRRLDIQVIHLHTEGKYLPSALSVWAAMGFRRRAVRTVHSIFSPTGVGYLRRLGQAVVGDRLVRVVVAPSADVARVERSFFRRCPVVYNWVDERFWALRQRRSTERVGSLPPVAVIVGNCSEVKQHQRALRAVLHSGFRAFHIGNEQLAGPEELGLLAELEAQGRLLGRGVGAPDGPLLSGDLFVMPSAREGMGVALAEAVVAGVPAMINDVPGLQWARGLPGVSFIADNDEAWIAGLQAWHPEPSGPTPAAVPSIDFSPRRGAAEYAAIYRQVSAK